MEEMVLDLMTQKFWMRKKIPITPLVLNKTRMRL